MALPEPTSIFEYSPRSPRLSNSSFSSNPRNNPLMPSYLPRSTPERPSKTACISIDPPNKIPPHLNEDSLDVNELQQNDQQQRLSSSPSNSLYASSPTLSALDNLSNHGDDDCCKTPTLKLAETAESVRVVAKQISNARVRWTHPRTVLIVTKAGDAKIARMTRELASWLITTPRYGDDCGVTVYVDSKLEKSRYFNYAKLVEKSDIFKSKLLFWTPALCRSQPQLFDFVVTLGGDGTVLFTSWLFQSNVPPVLPFHLGSLGFLTNFDFTSYKEHLQNAMEEGVRINLRMRFTCKVYRCKKNVTGSANQLSSSQDRNRQDEDMVALRDPKTNKLSVRPRRESDSSAITPCITTVHTETFEILNDLVVDRGPSPYVSMLELFGDDQHLTTVQADGLVISTPTGSTAYSLSAGGPLTHPEIPAFLITPICPHTLSFRPMLLPDSMELRICVPLGSRSTAWASFDGRGRIELKQGDHIKISASSHPFPTICSTTQSADWFNSLSRCLRWNERQRQKSFVVVESSPKKTKRQQVSSPTSTSSTSSLSSSIPSQPRSSSPSIASTAPSSVPTSPLSKPISQPPQIDEFFALIVPDQKSTPATSTSSWGDSDEREDYDEEEEEEEDWASDDGGEELVGWTDEEIYQSTKTR